MTTTAAARPAGVRSPLPAVRALLGAFCVLTAAGFVDLFFLAASTERTFAWTVVPPVTAAFLGAGYGAGFVLSALSLRARAWADVRLPYLTVAVFTWLTAAATFTHLERMHVATPGSGPLAEVAAWVWIVVYVAVPLAMAALLGPQERAGGADPARRTRLPAGLKAAIGVEGAMLLVVGAALSAAPSTAQQLWPWALTPLTARAVASWLLAFGVAAALAQGTDDLARLRTSAVAYAVFGALQLAVVGRWAGQVTWGAAAWAYCAVAAAVAATGLAGVVVAERRLGRPAPAGRTSLDPG